MVIIPAVKKDARWPVHWMFMLRLLQMFRLNVLFLFGHNTVLMLCLGLGTKRHLPRVRKTSRFGFEYLFWSEQKTHGDGLKHPHRLNCDWLFGSLGTHKNAAFFSFTSWCESPLISLSCHVIGHICYKSQPWTYLWSVEMLTVSIRSCWIGWAGL